MASTGQATSLGSSVASLNGVVDSGLAGSMWFFEYSPSSAFAYADRVTPVLATGIGLRVVSATVHGLAPGTRYWFRVAVAWSALPGLSRGGRFGVARSFRTTTGRGRARGASGALKRARRLAT